MPDLAESTTSTQDVEGLQNIDDNGKPPESRLADYKSAAAIVKHLIDEDELDRLDRINEQALLDGQGPFIQEELEKAGQGWRQNNNWGGAAAKFEQALAPYHDLLNGFTAELPPDISGSQREEWQGIIAEGWQVLHTRYWRNHAYQNHNLYRLFVGFGVGIADFEHPRDWRWRAGGLGEHYFPRPMQAYENAANIHVRVREYREDELWAWYNLPDATAKAVGFNKDEIKKAMLACNESADNASGYWNGLTNNIYGTTYARRALVRLFTMRTVEMTDDGEMVSEYMGREDSKGEDFIYRSKKPAWQDSMDDCITLYTAGIGNGDLHSIKGLARKVFAPSQTENQFINQMYDFARIFMSPMFESDSANAAQLLSSMQIGLFNLIPKGLKLVSASAVAPNYAQSILPLLGFSSQLGQQASGIFQQTMTPGSVEKTREEVVQTTMQNAVLTSAAITLFSAAKERQYNTSLKRLVSSKYSARDPGYKERELFIEYCTDRGVPRDVVLRTAYIKPNRQVGGGSAAVGQMLLEKSSALLRPYLDPVSQKILDEMVATRLLGPDTAKVLIPKIGIVRTGQVVINAQEENRWFKHGESFPPNPDDDHFLHAQTHDQMIAVMTAQAAQIINSQPVDPSQPNAAEAPFLAFLNAMIPHQNAHLQALALAGPNPQQKNINEFKLTLNKAVQDQQHLTAKAQRQQNILAQQAQAEAERQQRMPSPGGPGIDVPKLQQRAAEAQQDLQIEAARGNQELSQNERLHQQDLAHRQQDQQIDAAGRDAKHAAEVVNTSTAAPPAVIPSSVYPMPMLPGSTQP